MKEEYGIRDIIYQFQKEISYYSQMEAYGTTPYEKKYHRDLIEERTEELVRVLERYAANAGTKAQQQPENIPKTVPELPPEIAPLPSPFAEPLPGMAPGEEPLPAMPQVPPSLPGTAPEPEVQRTFTLEELSYYNGAGDRPAYVAVNGVVYDLSRRIGWAGGTHFGLYSGNDLTSEFTTCHRGLESILEQLPVAGILVSG